MEEPILVSQMELNILVYFFDHYCAVTTSYDFDAPINEAEDATENFYALREVIKRYNPLPPPPVPSPSPIKDLMEI